MGVEPAGKELLDILLQHLGQAPFLAVLNSNFHDRTLVLPPAYHHLEWIVGVGFDPEDEELPVPNPDAPGGVHPEYTFEALERAMTANPAFRMGYFSYGMTKHSLGQESNLTEATGCPKDWFWFRPSLLMAYGPQGLEFLVDRDSRAPMVREWMRMAAPMKPDFTGPLLENIMVCQTTFGEYSRNIERIREEIRKGTFYELNYCIEWLGHAALDRPEALWEQMTHRAGAPFSGFVKNRELFVLCNSPERFLRKEGRQLTSQPIKGTARRHPSPKEDQARAESLRASIKDNAEHVMIVDLVRHDLSRCCDPLSVRVEELMQCYGFKSVHQLISTITGRLPEKQSWSDALKACFPMGSMTGAPKPMVCRWIEYFEKRQRGIYSGSLGWMHPSGDFDLNVVIRTLVYDRSTQELSLAAGGAITWDSTAEQEWEECDTKARSILELRLP
jgi:para-aminobenzoate synthetase component 1